MKKARKEYIRSCEISEVAEKLNLFGISWGSVLALFSESKNEKLKCITLEGEGHIHSERAMNAVFEEFARAAGV